MYDYMDTTSSSPKRVPLPTTLDIYETNVYNSVAEYHYFHYRRENDYFRYRRRERLFPSTKLDPLRNARFEGITRDDRDEMPLHV